MRSSSSARCARPTLAAQLGLTSTPHPHPHPHTPHTPSPHPHAHPHPNQGREAKLTAQLGKLRRDKVMHAKGHKRKMTADDGKPRQFKFKQVRSR